jgi:hypothetical protein
MSCVKLSMCQIQYCVKYSPVSDVVPVSNVHRLAVALCWSESSSQTWARACKVPRVSSGALVPHDHITGVYNESERKSNAGTRTRGARLQGPLVEAHQVGDALGAPPVPARDGDIIHPRIGWHAATASAKQDM